VISNGLKKVNYVGYTRQVNWLPKSAQLWTNF